MEIGEALRQVDREVILAGNLDPSSIFHNGTPELVAEQARLLMEKARGYKNFIPSSGCDLAPHTPVANLEAFYATVRGFAE
jgi:uroporphyrinogen decarboxylase